MKRAFFTLLILLLAGAVSRLDAQQKNVVFKLKPQGDCKKTSTDPQKPFDVVLCVARCRGNWVSVCSYSSKTGTPNTIAAEGYTVAVETVDPRIEFVELKLGADVPNNGEVAFFSPSIQSNLDGKQWLIANVIFEQTKPATTMTIAAGETSSKSLIEFRMALGQNWADDDSVDTEVYLTDKATLNGFPQRNQVTEGGLSLLADISTPQSRLHVPLQGPRIEILGCEFLPRDCGSDPFQVKVRWEVYGECPVYWWYTKSTSGGCPDHGFRVYVDGEVWKFPDSSGTPSKCEFIAFPEPNPKCQEDPACPDEKPDIIRCDPRPPRQFEAIVEFPLARANGYHRFKVCAEFRATCEDCPDGCPRPQGGPCPPAPLPPEGTICSNECTNFVPVIKCDCRTCTEDPKDPDACQNGNTGAGPYWCLVNPRYMLGDSNGNLFTGDTTVRDFDMLNDAQKKTFRENGPKMAFQFGSSCAASNLCIVRETLVCLDWRGQEILHLDPDWRPSNNADGGPPVDTCCPNAIAGVPKNVPREVPVHIVVLQGGNIVNFSIDPACKYIFGWKRGDVNLDQVVNVMDSVDLLNGIFMMNSDHKTTSPYYLACHRSANVNGGTGRGDDDAMINVSDAIYLLQYLLLGGKDPLSPFHIEPFHPDGFGNVSGAVKDCEDPYPTGSGARVRCPFCTSRASCTTRG